MQHGDEPELPEHHSRSTDGSIARKIGSYFPANNLNRDRNNYFAQAPFTFDRNQIDSRFDYNGNSKFNMSGTLGMLHYSAVTPTVFGDAAVGRPIGGSSNPGTGHGNTYRVTVMGTYISVRRSSWTRTTVTRAREQFRATRPRAELRAGHAGHPGRERHANVRKRVAHVLVPGLRHHWGQRKFHAVYRHDPQSQYVVNFNLIKSRHNIRFGSDIYDMALNQTQAEFITGGFGAQGGFGFNRGVTERCEAVNAATGNCQQTSRGSFYNSAAAFVIGQASSAGRTLQVPDVYHLNARLYSSYIRDRWTATDKLTIDYGTRWEYFPVPTRPDRGIEFYDVTTGNVLLCGVGSTPTDCGIKSSKTRFGPRVGPWRSRPGRA